MPMLASKALATMNDWDELDAVDVLLRRVSRTWGRKSPTVKEWADDLIEKRVWRGGFARKRERMSKGRKASPRKRNASKSASATPPPPKQWTKAQREEAARKKAIEADEAALQGVRKSARASVPSKKLLGEP